MASHIRPAFALCGVLAVFAVPGFAQTNTGVSREHTYSTLGATRVYAASYNGAYDDVALAPNIIVAELYRPVVRGMLERSATFRRQCARIAGATNLTIEIRSEPPPASAPAAWTTIQRRLGQPTSAVIVVPSSGRTAELIAHELEHVIEQLDGIDLAKKADVRGSGVRHCACGEDEAFETTRAILTGRQVAEDVGERRR
jgi:hypothetical protein